MIIMEMAMMMVMDGVGYGDGNMVTMMVLES